MLNAKDAAIDIYLIDIVNPAQYYGAGWLEPLDAYLGKPADVMKPYLPVYATSNVVDGKIAAMPAFADAMFMYWRCSSLVAPPVSISILTFGFLAWY